MAIVGLLLGLVLAIAGAAAMIALLGPAARRTALMYHVTGALAGVLAVLGLQVGFMLVGAGDELSRSGRVPTGSEIVSGSLFFGTLFGIAAGDAWRRQPRAPQPEHPPWSDEEVSSILSLEREGRSPAELRDAAAALKRAAKLRRQPLPTQLVDFIDRHSRGG